MPRHSTLNLTDYEVYIVGNTRSEHELMKWKPIRRAQGDYEKMMKFMKFHTSDELGNYYEVKDPDLLRMKKQNESLKSALNEANQSVKQIQVNF